MALTADGVLEGSIVGSFTNLGYRIRSRDWDASVAEMPGATAVITGATSGIGLAAAKRMAGLGARVALVGRNEQKLEAAVTEVSAGSEHEAVAYRADLSSLDQVRRPRHRLCFPDHRRQPRHYENQRHAQGTIQGSPLIDRLKGLANAGLENGY